MIHKSRSTRAAQHDHRIVRPPVDIYETDKEIMLYVEMPGVSKDTLDIELQGTSLTISAFRKKEHINGKYAELYNERFTEIEYLREFQLNADIDRHKLLANYLNGVLEVILVKSHASTPQKIPIS